MTASSTLSWVPAVAAIASAITSTLSALAAWIAVKKNFYTKKRKLHLIVVPRVMANTNLSQFVHGTQAGQVGAISPIVVMISNLGKDPEIVTSIHLTTDPNMGHDGSITPTLIKPGDNVLFELWFNQAGLEKSFEMTGSEKLAIYLSVGYSQAAGASTNKRFSVGVFYKPTENSSLGSMGFPFETSNTWIEKD